MPSPYWLDMNLSLAQIAFVYTPLAGAFWKSQLSLVDDNRTREPQVPAILYNEDVRFPPMALTVSMSPLRNFVLRTALQLLAPNRSSIDDCGL